MKCKLDYTVDDYLTMLIETNDKQLSYSLVRSRELINIIYSPVDDNATNLQLTYNHFDNERFKYYNELVKYYNPIPSQRVGFVIINLLPIEDFRGFFFFCLKSFMRFDFDGYIKYNVVSPALALEHLPSNAYANLSNRGAFHSHGIEYSIFDLLEGFNKLEEEDSKLQPQYYKRTISNTTRLMVSYMMSFIKQCQDLVNETIYDDIFFENLDVALYHIWKNGKPRYFAYDKNTIHYQSLPQQIEINEQLRNHQVLIERLGNEMFNLMGIPNNLLV